MLTTILPMVVIESLANARPHKIETVWDIIKFNSDYTHPLNNFDVRRINYLAQIERDPISEQVSKYLENLKADKKEEKSREMPKPSAFVKV